MTDHIDSIIEKDEACKKAFMDFLNVLHKVYPLLTFSDCVNMISESIIIAPIQKILFDPSTNKLDSQFYLYEHKIIEALKPYKITGSPEQLNELYEFIRSRSVHMDRQQLITLVYDDLYRAALPNRFCVTKSSLSKTDSESVC